jgi:hypothetical protein
MSTSIRGHQTAVKFFRNGQLVNLATLTRFEIQMDSSMSKSFYVGSPVPEGDQTIEGWSGSADLEVKGPELDDLMDAIINQNMAGVGVDEITIVDTEMYPDGRSRTYVYSGVRLSTSKSQGGLNEKVTKRLNIQANLRTLVR